MCRIGEIARQGRIVGEQEKATGRLIESPDGMHVTQVRRQHIEDRLTALFVTVRRDDSLGFMKEEKSFDRVLNRLVVERDRIFRPYDPRSRITHDSPIDADSSCTDPFLTSFHGKQCQASKAADPRLDVWTHGGFMCHRGNSAFPASRSWPIAEGMTNIAGCSKSLSSKAAASRRGGGVRSRVR